jgi:16S rRNA (adenine1518-N6/adenine1519-N6)-dimethyltransferase
VTTIRRRLADLSLAANKKLGQHFLHDEALARRIVDFAAVSAGDRVIEIGPGLGALTWLLAERAALVKAVEIDRGLAGHLADEVARRGTKNVEIIHADAVGFDYAAAAAPGRLMVVGNLPYNVTGPILFDLVRAHPLIKRATLLIQAEVADRLHAAPGGRDYGVLSVLLAACGRLTPGETVSAEPFFPRPKVVSRLIAVDFKPQTEVADDFIRLVKAAFSSRRKTLKNSLAGGLGLSQDAAANLIVAAGIDPGCRAETLAPDRFAALTRAWRGRSEGDQQP